MAWSAFRRLLAGGLTAIAVLSGGTLTGAASAHAAPLAAPSPSAATSGRQVAFGLDVRPTSGQSAQAALLAGEARVGHKLAFTRDFLRWDSAFPTSYEKWLGARGTLPMIAVRAQRHDGSVVSWSSIAHAQPGSTLYQQIVSWGTRLRDFGYRVFFTFNHEPESKNNTSRGTSADYVAAWRHVHDVFAAVGATNVRYLWNLTSYAFEVPSSDRRAASRWYPGDSYVDAIGADAYNWGSCLYDSWQSLPEVISGFMRFGAQHPTKSMWLPEYGSVEGSANRKAGWIAYTQSVLKTSAYARIRGVSYYDAYQPGFSCSWPIHSSTSATNAMRAMAGDPFFHGAA